MPRGIGTGGGRYVITGLSPAAQAELVKSLALRAERVAAPAGAKAGRPRIGAVPRQYEHGRRLDALGARRSIEFEYVRVSGADIQAGNLRDRIDVLVLADDARVLEGGGGRGGRGAADAAPRRRRSGRRRIRPAGRGDAAPQDLTAANEARVVRSTSSSARAARSSASTAAATSRSINSSCR